MSKHTPEPWYVDEEEAMVRTGWRGPNTQDYICMMVDQSNDYGKSWDEINSLGDNQNDEIKANARRIAACVNFCAPVELTETLEKGTFEDAKTAIIKQQGEDIDHQIDLRLKAEAEVARLSALLEAVQVELRIIIGIYHDKHGGACTMHGIAENALNRIEAEE